MENGGLIIEIDVRNESFSNNKVSLEFFFYRIFLIQSCDNVNMEKRSRIENLPGASVAR